MTIGLFDDWRQFKSDAGSLGVNVNEDQLKKFQLLLELMQKFNKRASLTSDLGLRDAMHVHFLDSLSLVPSIENERLQAGKLIDIGTGGGFPGLPLKIVLPSMSVHFIESTKKKAEYLKIALKELSLEGIVVPERAEDIAHDSEFREKFDLVTARALGNWSTVLELCLPFCRIGGYLFAQRGENAKMEARKYSEITSLFGGRVYDVISVGTEIGLDSRNIIVVRKINAVPEKFPRKSGIPAKRPLE